MLKAISRRISKGLDTTRMKEEGWGEEEKEITFR
jgi:hypothetical protein